VDRVTPTVCLVTDFGRADSYVAEMHLAIHARVPALRVVDVTHDLAPFDRRGAALAIERALAEMAPGDALVAVVDPGVGTSRARLIVRVRGRYGVGPDNGILPIIQGAEVWKIERPTPREGVSTFDGREVFGPVGAMLAAGLSPALVGSRWESAVSWVMPPDAPFESAGASRYARGVVIALDRYGNAVTSVRLPPGVSPPCAEVVSPERFAGPLRTSYGSVGAGDPLALVGSSGRVELAVREGSTGLAVDIEVVVRCAN
jgi:S-adenosylmethionine hydrolase